MTTPIKNTGSVSTADQARNQQKTSRLQKCKSYLGRVFSKRTPTKTAQKVHTVSTEKLSSASSASSLSVESVVQYKASTLSDSGTLSTSITSNSPKGREIPTVKRTNSHEVIHKIANNKVSYKFVAYDQNGRPCLLAKENGIEITLEEDRDRDVEFLASSKPKTPSSPSSSEESIEEISGPIWDRTDSFEVTEDGFTFIRNGEPRMIIREDGITFYATVDSDGELDLD